MKPMLHKLVFVVALAAATGVWAAPAAEIEIHKHPQCGCCTLWARHLVRAGFEVELVPAFDNAARWREFKVPPSLGACHTALVDGYVIEGHVPAADIKRLLAERPDAVGLVVPGMPLGSPGMEAPAAQPFEVLLLKADGTTEVFARHTP